MSYISYHMKDKIYHRGDFPRCSDIPVDFAIADSNNILWFLRIDSELYAIFFLMNLRVPGKILCFIAKLYNSLHIS